MTVRPGGQPAVTTIKWGTLDISNIKLGVIDLWSAEPLNEQWDDSSVSPGLGPGWTDRGTAVAPYQAAVINDSYARMAFPDPGLISPPISTMTTRYQYTAAVMPNDNSFVEFTVGPMGSWRNTIRTRVLLRTANGSWSDGIGIALASTGDVWVSSNVGTTETLTPLTGSVKPGDVIRLIPNGRQLTINKGGRWFGEWLDSAGTTQIGSGYRTVGVSWMGAKDGPIGVRHLSPAIMDIHGGGGVKGVAVASARTNLITQNKSASVRLDKNYVPRAGDTILVCIGISQSGRTFTFPAGWVNVLGGSTVIDSGVSQAALIYHTVTSAEEQAGTDSWSLPNVLSGTSFGYATCLALRGVDPANIVDAVATVSSGTRVTPHATAALSGANVVNKSTVLAFMERAGKGAYDLSATPDGWSQVITNTTAGTSAAPWNYNIDTGSRTVFLRNAQTQAGVAVPSVNIAPTAADAYIGFTIALGMLA